MLASCFPKDPVFERELAFGAGDTSIPSGTRRVRVCYFNSWARGLQDADSYVAGVPYIPIATFVTNSGDSDLLTKARLDCDWYGENTRVFSAMRHEGLAFLPAMVCGLAGVPDIAAFPKVEGEERWFVTMGHQPQALGPLAGKAFELLAKKGVKHLYYAFDEASRFMPCFNDIAPHLDVLVHDEEPLAEAGRAKLKAGCRNVHRSWVANVAPFDVPFNEAPEEKILFLGSQLGLTQHRERQIAHLKATFKDRFVAISDHSVSVQSRAGLNRFKVGFCPEGRKFTTAPMAGSHTDRPFWSGCSGLVPVSEDSSRGGRLEELHGEGLIIRYPKADLKALVQACEKALSLDNSQRRRIYDRFNERETVGTVVSDLIHASA
ncbi:MAG TPA: hypothetical protein VFE25_16340 [Opitutaceae bacterium]|jgi:hypothetical protein|nr:hypothetical protein [Opitutaceae bacterium]